MIRVQVEAPWTSTETASVSAPAAALSLLNTSRTMQALTPTVSLKVSANRVFVNLRAHRCGKIWLAGMTLTLAPGRREVPWTMCTRFGRRVTPVRAPVRETPLTRVLVDSLCVTAIQLFHPSCIEHRARSDDNPLAGGAE